jgi:hypothetical protein
MWASPVILLWPLLGPFPQASVDAWSYLERVLQGLRDPFILVPECLGLTEIIYLLFEGRSRLLEKSRAPLPSGHLSMAGKRWDKIGPD